ncbi:hypothetical protein [Amycolatopsis benzoatilytica]|uniref:hypothetical protein n=1 Tax=Amycolatopsis benzoatilytica TaxID=346045 RepID=UPI000363ABFC|nr:hypothetical protein [Amycolatopsis benzoatilytica]
MSTPTVWSGRHPGTQHFEALFEHTHLPEHLAEISAPFGRLAEALVAALPDGPELSAGLRKLVEAKDCFVRAQVAYVKAGRPMTPIGGGR